MRIMHLLNHCGKANGHVNVSVDLACTQARMGHAVGYGSSGGDFLELLQKSGVNLYEIAQPHRSLKGFCKANWQLLQAIRSFKPDVLHAHMAAQSVILQPYRLFGYKFVTTLHNEFDRSAWLMGLATSVVTVSRTGYEAMRRHGIPEDRIHLVENGSVGSPRLGANFQKAQLKRPAILTVCGMHPRKGIADLLQAFAISKKSHSDLHLYLVGEGPMQSAYKELSVELGIDDSVNFVGFCEDPRKYLFAADVFVLASHADPCPLVVAEARNAGLPIIATNIDGIPGMLDYGEAGMLVPPQCPNVLAEALCRILDDSVLRQAYAMRAQQGIERFNVERVCRDMEKVYRSIL